jgi:hypothetical protein
MAIYCIAMRIADETIEGRTAQDRWNSVRDAIFSDKQCWDELGSFFMTESQLTTQEFARKASGGLSRKHDVLVAFDTSDMSVGYFGNFQQFPQMASFFAIPRAV